MNRNLLMKLMHYKIPYEYQKCSIIHCHYCILTYAYYMMCLIIPGIVMTGFLFFLFGMFLNSEKTRDYCSLLSNAKEIREYYLLLTDPKITGDIFLFFIMSGMCLLVIVLGCWIGCYMKNFTVIFHNSGVWYRDILGRVYQYRDEEVLGYTEHGNLRKRYKYFTIHTKNKKISVKRASADYDKAVNLIRKKYLSFKER